MDGLMTLKENSSAGISRIVRLTCIALFISQSLWYPSVSGIQVRVICAGVLVVL